MRKAGYVNLTIALTLLCLAVILFLSWALGLGALDSEKRFIAGLYNSLYHLDLAKQHWAEEKKKSELETPTLPDLMPYLGTWKNAIERFKAYGINYTITSMAEPQSDVATLTRDLRFRSGICHFYSASTSYCLQTGWAHPQSSITSSLRALYFNNQHLVVGALCVVAAGNLLVFVMKKIRRPKEAAILTEK